MMKVNVNAIKAKYTVGSKIKFISTQKGILDAPPSGTVGRITGVDKMGQIHVKWKNGSRLAVIPGIDKFSMVYKEAI